MGLDISAQAHGCNCRREFDDPWWQRAGRHCERARLGSGRPGPACNRDAVDSGDLHGRQPWPAIILLIPRRTLANSPSGSWRRWFRRIAIRQAIAMTIASTAILGWLHFHLRLGSLLTVEYSTWAAATMIALYAACYPQGLGAFGRFNLLRVVPGVLPALLMFIEATTVHLTPAEAAAAYLVPTWCTAVPALIWLRQVADRGSAQPLSPRTRRSMRSYGWRSLASFSGLALNRSADQLALGFLVPAGSLGLFSVAASASSPLVSAVSSFGMVGLPTVTALVGRAKTQATWRTMWRAACLLAVIAPALAALIPLAIPLVYGARYSSAVGPAEILLAGTVFAAFASVADDLLRAHGHPGFVSITQGAGGIVTLVGTLLLDGRPLAAVALVSSLGFILAFALALLRLSAATRRLRSPAKHRKTRDNTRLTPLCSLRRMDPVVSLPRHFGPRPKTMQSRVMARWRARHS